MRVVPGEAGEGMTLKTNARLAGFTFLLYIAVGIAIMVVSGRAVGGIGAAERLASLARHGTEMRVTVLLALVTVACAVVLAVTLYRITREVDEDLAMLGMICRVLEGVFGAVGAATTLGLIWLATTAAPSAPGGLEVSASAALGGLLLESQGWDIGAICFAVGSALFCYLLLRGRLIPRWLAWIGVVASVLLVVGLPLQLVGWVSGAVVGILWIPMALFEVPLGIWLMVRGVESPAP